MPPGAAWSFPAWSGVGHACARVSPGRSWVDHLLAACVFLQGCGTDAVDHVLPIGHLCPPAHLHCLLGYDSSVSFALLGQGVCVCRGGADEQHFPAVLLGGQGPLLWAGTALHLREVESLGAVCIPAPICAGGSTLCQHLGWGSKAWSVHVPCFP